MSIVCKLIHMNPWNHLSIMTKIKLLRMRVLSCLLSLPEGPEVVFNMRKLKTPSPIEHITIHNKEERRKDIQITFLLQD